MKKLSKITLAIILSLNVGRVRDACELFVGCKH